MQETERIKKQKELIEYIGRHSEQEGIQPAAARVAALLMVMDQEEFTFEEIVTETRFSKGAISTALKNLELRGLIECITHHGDRKRYFRVVANDLKTIIEKAEQKIRIEADLIDRVISLKKNQYSGSVQFLKSVSKGLYFFLSKTGELKKLHGITDMEEVSNSNDKPYP